MRVIFPVILLLSQIFSKEIVFLSTQLVPVHEAEWTRKVMFPPFEKEKGIKVLFLGAEQGELADRLTAEYIVNKGKTDIVGGLHGDFASLHEIFKDLKKDLEKLEKLKDRSFIKGFKEAGNIKEKQVYVSWLQETYIFAVNKKAFKYLPENIDILYIFTEILILQVVTLC